ncbi:MAG: L-histidine N(alpha)-methyltransferase [Thermoanaerobaculia bacterium]|nr:L-histidine N(alpha)-methyltransferase [Thermoanaerobaculia bacterium]
MTDRSFVEPSTEAERLTIGGRTTESHRLDDQSPETAEILREVLDGLRSKPKSIHPKFLYDERGSQLFDRITKTPEYYPTRTELRILEQHGDDMGRLLGPRCLVVEPGAGSVQKIRSLLEHLDDPVAYMPVDISLAHLRKHAAELAADFPELQILTVAADYTTEYELPRPATNPLRRVVFFPGSTIGNFPYSEAVEFLEHLAQVAGPGGALLLGADLVKDRDVLLRAYDDSEGVTAQFILNLLHRFNRELGADFDSSGFQHLAIWNAASERIEIYLRVLRDQIVRLGGEEIRFEAGEKVLAEYSQKYTRTSFADMAADAGLRVERVWADERDWFSVQYLTRLADS